MVGLLAAHLFGRHVAHGAQHRAGFGLVRERLRALIFGRCQFGQAKIEDLHPALAGHHDVLQLQVAVDDALVVRCG